MFMALLATLVTEDPKLKQKMLKLLQTALGEASGKEEKNLHPTGHRAYRESPNITSHSSMRFLCQKRWRFLYIR